MAELYADTDVVLKLSSVEGMFGPPLEGFHRGATCVVTPVTGHEEYVEHGYNGLLTDWDDLRGTARQLDLLARDRALLHFLRTNALETARGVAGLGAVQPVHGRRTERHRPRARAGDAASTARLIADLRGGIELYQRRLQERADFARRALRFERRIARIRRDPSACGWMLKLGATRARVRSRCGRCARCSPPAWDVLRRGARR